jgi:hypothetical protein
MVTSATALYQGRYRIPSARKAGADYTSGAFFVTWNVQNRECVLARIAGGVAHLTEIGHIVDEEWHATAVVRSNVTLGAWVVMPDHVHGTILINDVAPTDHVTDDVRVETGRRPVSTVRRPVSTIRRPVNAIRPPVDVIRPPVNAIRPPVNANREPADMPPASQLRPGSLGSIVGQIKSLATKRIRASGHANFAWQARFYDRILLDEHALAAATEYILQNPARWRQGRDAE